MIVIDVQHVFRVFRGPAGLLAALDRYQPDHGLSYSTVQMWQRRQIPTRYVGAVLYVIEQTGHSCVEFMIDKDEFGARPRR